MFRRELYDLSLLGFKINILFYHKALQPPWAPPHELPTFASTSHEAWEASSFSQQEHFLPYKMNWEDHIHSYLLGTKLYNCYIMCFHQIHLRLAKSFWFGLLDVFISKTYFYLMFNDYWWKKWSEPCDKLCLSAYSLATSHLTQLPDWSCLIYNYFGFSWDPIHRLSKFLVVVE